jgi:hypothetical protein
VREKREVGIQAVVVQKRAFCTSREGSRSKRDDEPEHEKRGTAVHPLETMPTMKKSLAHALGFAAALLALPLGAFAASTAAPVPIPTPKLPARALHSSIIVEVNKRGQVVRIKGGELSHDSVFDTMTIGNALQMWIRRPDGSATVGLFRVNYDYDPHTHNVGRHVELISAGGSWGNDSGAATKMVNAATSETRAAYERLQADERRRQAESAKHLPDINAAVKRALASPTSSPKP